MALVLAFLMAENENQQLEDLPLADFGCLPQRLLLLVRTKSIRAIKLNTQRKIPYLHAPMYYSLYNYKVLAVVV